MSGPRACFIVAFSLILSNQRLLCGVSWLNIVREFGLDSRLVLFGSLSLIMVIDGLIGRFRELPCVLLLSLDIKLVIF